jgi:hypothetical protein
MFTFRFTEQPIAERVAGGLLIAIALAFVAVFGLLQASFNYPDVLAESGHVVLPRLLAGGESLRLTWLAYALIPLMIVPITALLVGRFDGGTWARPSALRQSVLLTGALALITLTLGFIRWPSLNWSLAEAYLGASPEVQQAIVAQFDGMNALLGTFVGELLGEIFLYAWIGLGAVLSAQRLPRWVLVFTLLAAGSGEVGAWRAFSGVAQGFADVNNALLPLAFIVWGLGLAVGRKAKAVKPEQQATDKGASPLRASVLVVVLALTGLTAYTASAQTEQSLAGRELSITGFRNPSTGLEYRWNHLSVHAGFYPTILATGSKGEDQDNSFYRFGVGYWFLPFGKQEVPSAFYVSASYLTRSNTTVRVTNAAIIDAGVRWVVWRGLALRLGVSTTAADNGLWYVNPTPGISYSFRLK